MGNLFASIEVHGVSHRSGQYGPDQFQRYVWWLLGVHVGERKGLGGVLGPFHFFRHLKQC
jgi:hypothetical protein